MNFYTPISTDITVVVEQYFPGVMIPGSLEDSSRNQFVFTAEGKVMLEPGNFVIYEAGKKPAVMAEREFAAAYVLKPVEKKKAVKKVAKKKPVKKVTKKLPIKKAAKKVSKKKVSKK